MVKLSEVIGGVMILGPIHSLYESMVEKGILGDEEGEEAGLIIWDFREGSCVGGAAWSWVVDGK
jgi:hypothetical protein